MEQEYFRIEGGRPLFGRTLLHGAKNAVLPLLASAVMTEKPVTIADCPYISDVDNMLATLSALGVKAEKNGREITVSGAPGVAEVPSGLAGVMRSSVFMLGALLSAFGEVRLSTPGGCRIGARPLDIHLDGLQRMGAIVEYGEDFVHCFARKLNGAEIIMKYPSVGATENLLMAAVLAKGRTTLIGCAREPEVVSLARGLRLMGARISGEGSQVMTIDGVDELDGAFIIPVSDRIVCGTVMAAAVLCGGTVEIENADASNLQSVIAELKNDRCDIFDSDGCIIVESDGRPLPFSAVTGPYPLFPTDMQAQLMACALAAPGISSITETVFENRFAQVPEFRKMGADITVNGRTAVIRGRQPKPARDLIASDLRGGAGLVIAALKAKGVSGVFNVGYIDRGYEKIEETFSSLGADMRREKLFI